MSILPILISMALCFALIYFIFHTLFRLLKAVVRKIKALLRPVPPAQTRPAPRPAPPAPQEEKEEIYIPWTGIPGRKNTVVFQTTAPAAAPTSELMAECPGCGAPLDMDTDRLKLVCPYCDRVYPMPADWVGYLLDSRREQQRAREREAERQHNASIARQKQQAEERERAERLEYMRRESRAVRRRRILSALWRAIKWTAKAIGCLILILLAIAFLFS